MSNEIKLTSMASNCGCGAKLPPGLLDDMLSCITPSCDPNLITGIGTKDDACVYKITQEIAMIQTLDFFTPIVDDPFIFGQIAAANALSDIFAMGAEPKLALNMLCVPHNMKQSIIKDILMGGNHKVSEAGAMITGGHTIEDEVPKYGLSVTGFSHPSKLLFNSGAKDGDMLILTKPLGTGILNTAMKMNLVDDKTYQLSVESMITLNKTARDIMSEYEVHACTDITGFGFLGHLLEIAQGSNVTAHVASDLLPIFPKVLQLAKDNILPSSAYKNKNFLKDAIAINQKIPSAMVNVMLDPQTSGGLLICVSPNDAQKLLQSLKENISHACVVGHISNKQEKDLMIG